MTHSSLNVEAIDQTEDILAEISEEFGMLPNFFQAQATVDPEWLRLNWLRTKQILIAEGALDRKTKELIAMCVSMVNHCDYCALSHEAMAIKTGATEQEINEAKQIIELLVSFNAIANSLRIRCDIIPGQKPSNVISGSDIFKD